MAGLFAVVAPANAAPVSAPEPVSIGECDTTPAPGHLTCLSVRADRASSTSKQGLKPMASTPVSGTYGPSDFKTMYGLPAFTGSPTIAIVDVGHYPRVESDLATYRTQYKLPSCTSASGCFTEVNQYGQQSPLPAQNASWNGEIMLDLDVVSGVCPTCKILLVSADSDGVDDLMTAASTATSLGAQYVSMSFGGSEYSDEAAVDDAYLKAPNVTYVASTGDDGFAGGTSWPAVAQGVIGAGGTTVKRTGAVGSATEYTATAWNGAGSGCSAYEARPAAQATTAPLTAVCGHRATADVSALADPATGVAVYLNGSWYAYGGTSAAAPAIAAMYAMAGNHTNAFSVYDNIKKTPTAFRDVTSGTTLGCSASNTLCTAKAGWDGPTGLGMPKGLTGLTSTTAPVPPTQLTIHNPGPQVVKPGQYVSLDVRPTSKYPSSGLNYSGQILSGFTLNNGYITGIVPNVRGTVTFTVTVSSPVPNDPTFRSGTISFPFTVTTATSTPPKAPVLHKFVKTGKVKINGVAKVNKKVSASLGVLHRDSAKGAVVRPKVTLSWYLNGKAIAGAHGKTLKVKKSWRGKRLSFTVTAKAAGYKALTYTSPKTGRIR